MTRENSVEIGGRDSRTTSSIAWRNDEPARSALPMRVIVSGRLLVERPEPAVLAPAEPEARDHEADEPADEQEQRVTERGGDERQAEEEDRDADGAAGPDAEVLGDLELEVGAGDLAGQVGAEVALLDDPVEVRERRRSGR